MHVTRNTFLRIFSLWPHRRKDRKIICKLRWGNFRGEVRELKCAKGTKDPHSSCIVLFQGNLVYVCMDNKIHNSSLKPGRFFSSVIFSSVISA